MDYEVMTWAKVRCHPGAPLQCFFYNFQNHININNVICALSGIMMKMKIGYQSQEFQWTQFLSNHPFSYGSNFTKAIFNMACNLQETSVPHYVGLSIKLYGCLHDLGAFVPRISDLLPMKTFILQSVCCTGALPGWAKLKWWLKWSLRLVCSLAWPLTGICSVPHCLSQCQFQLLSLDL